MLTTSPRAGLARTKCGSNRKFAECAVGQTGPVQLDGEVGVVFLGDRGGEGAMTDVLWQQPERWIGQWFRLGDCDANI